MKGSVKEALIIFLVVGLFIFFKGFQSDLDFLSITLIYGMFIGYSIILTLIFSGIIKFIDWIFEYSRKFYKRTVKS